MEERFDKKGLSNVVSVLIIILLVFVAVSIVWVVIKNVINQNAEQISLGKITLNLDMEKVTQLQDNSLSVRVKREIGEGTFTGLKFVFKAKKISEVVDMENLSMKEYEVRTLVFNLKKINITDIKTIEISPLFTLQSGKQITGDVKDTWTVSEQPIETGGSAYQCSDSCSSLGYQCGTQTVCGVLTSCGNCNSNQECSAGICVSTGDTCSSLGFNCGTVNGQVCGECSAGQTCSAGECIILCTDTCDSLSHQCGIWAICGASINCGDCSTGQVCNSAGTCVASTTPTCEGSSTQSCTITNGVGSQSRTCTSGVWSSWGTCTVVSCNTDYVISGNSCVASTTPTCEGSSTQSCTITNGVGSQSRTCTSGVWSSWGTCTVVSCNTDYVISGNSCVASSNWQSGIVSWWNLDSDATDSVSNNDGVVSGATHLTSGCQYGGGCYSFNGVNGGGNYITMDNISSLDGFSQVTLSVWIYINGLPASGEKTIFGKELSYKLDLNSAGRVRFLTANLVTNWVNSMVISSSVLSTSNWINIVATYDGSVKRIYINGVQDPNIFSTTGSIRTNIRDFVIGAYEGSTGYWTNFDGSIDEVIVWNRALSASEVSEVYNHFN